MSNRMREFTLGLIYDAIGWTPDVTPQLAAVRNAKTDRLKASVRSNLSGKPVWKSLIYKGS
jgi:hypothetical protein